ncbi:MAG: type II toxin-antitoxin system VapC family toxin [Chloroflexi bacterium]|nr:type II toxin-antitoxin system VapC family toxin [Chloroflexota bacterium]
MASTTLVLDASVGVKWLSGIGEADVPAARRILDQHARGDTRIIVPDLFFHEVCNALVHKSSITVEQLMNAMTTLFELDLSVFFASAERLRIAARLARAALITEYDAIYVIAATDSRCPLVTANPKHQGKSGETPCQVIPLGQFRP